MKKLFIYLLTLTMLFTAVPVSAQANQIIVDNATAADTVDQTLSGVIGVLKKCYYCGNGYANITCQGYAYGPVNNADCTWEIHESLGCTTGDIYNYHNGRCSMCGGTYYPEEPVHKHAQRHTFAINGYEDYSSCIYL